MGRKMRNRVPSDFYLKAYDARMSARENEIRRPGRKIDVISNEDYYKMLEAMAEQRRKEEELQIPWQCKHLDAIRQRNNLIRYKLFLLFNKNFNIDTSNADTVSEQPLSRAIAAVCNSITKDSVAYTHLTSLSKDGDAEQSLYDKRNETSHCWFQQLVYAKDFVRRLLRSRTARYSKCASLSFLNTSLSATKMKTYMLQEKNACVAASESMTREVDGKIRDNGLLIQPDLPDWDMRVAYLVPHNPTGITRSKQQEVVKQVS